ncbi:hypothetical protein GGI35DRAFT_451586 [Trichoderma velutinum]
MKTVEEFFRPPHGLEDLDSDIATVEEFLRPPHWSKELDHVFVSNPKAVQKKDDPDNASENRQNHNPDNASERDQNHDPGNASEDGQNHDGQNHDLDNVSENSQMQNSYKSRHSPLAAVINWPEFDVQSTSLDPLIAICLKMPCEVRWRPHVPEFARVIYCERQLEALYLQTLITRVNIALDKAIPPEEERITIVVGPGAFESVTVESSAERVLPDWIVVQGNFDITMGANLMPRLDDLVEQHRILAVGDTKLVRNGGSIPDPIPHTRACHPNFLRQIQDYCANLCTRFGFILSNRELIVAQFKRAEEAAPRGVEERGLRSSGAQHFVRDVDSQGTSVFHSITQFRDSPQKPGIDNPYPSSLPLSPTPLPTLAQTPSKPSKPSKRRQSPTSPETSPVAAAAASRRNRYADRSYANRSFSGSSDTSNSEPRQTSSDPLAPAASSSQDHSKYAPSVRQVEIGAIKVRSFGMLAWKEDSFDMMDWEEENKENPYRVLFMFVMMIRALRLRGDDLQI